MTRSRSVLSVLGAALALTTCAPEYRSGETACAPTEPRCPEGFVCSGIRCYLRSDLPEAGTTPGTGGSSGTPGTLTGGTGGSAVPHGRRRRRTHRRPRRRGGHRRGGWMAPPSACQPAMPVECPGYAGICFAPNTACSSLVECGNRVRACMSATMVADCVVNTCTLPVAACTPRPTATPCAKCGIRKCCSAVANCINDPACAAALGIDPPPANALLDRSPSVARNSAPPNVADHHRQRPTEVPLLPATPAHRATPARRRPLGPPSSSCATAS